MFKELFFLSFLIFLSLGRKLQSFAGRSLTEVEQVMKRGLCWDGWGRVGKKILDKRENGRTELVCYQWKDIPNRGTHGGKKEFCWKVILNGGKKIFFARSS